MTFLLTWNPKKFHWDDYPLLCQYAAFPVYSDWSTCSRRMQTGDAFYFLMQGMGEKNGIVGHGKFVTHDMKGNWTDDPAYPLVFRRAGLRTYFVDIRIDGLINYKTEAYIRTSMLEYLFPQQNWRPQSSGTQIREDVAQKLKELVEGEMW